MNYYYDHIEEVEFQATVVDCKAINGLYHVSLTQSAFYVEKGGMERDFGTLNGIEVVDLYEEGITIIHVVSSPLSGVVMGSIDYEQRLKKAQIHSAQHIISYYLESKYPCITVSHHVSKEGADIAFDWFDVDTIPEIEAIDMNLLNEYCNQMIREARPINICYPTYEEYKTKQKKTNFVEGDEVRVVKLGEEDYNFCGCIHVPNTAAIQMIHVFAINRTKHGFTLNYQAGESMRLDYGIRLQAMRQSSILLKYNEYEVEQGVQKLLDSKQMLEKEVFSLKQQLISMIYDKILYQNEGNRVIVEEIDCLGLKEAQVLASKIVSNNDKILYLIVKLDDRCYVIFACHKQSTKNMKDDYELFVRNHQFKGGGSASMAQGGGLYEEDYLEEIKTIARERND